MLFGGLFYSKCVAVSCMLPNPSSDGIHLVLTVNLRRYRLHFIVLTDQCLRCSARFFYLIIRWDVWLFIQPYRSERPVNMEDLPVNTNAGQSYGYTLYETTITSGGTLNSRNNIRDRALVRIRRLTDRHTYVQYMHNIVSKHIFLFMFSRFSWTDNVLVVWTTRLKSWHSLMDRYWLFFCGCS